MTPPAVAKPCSRFLRQSICVIPCSTGTSSVEVRQVAVGNYGVPYRLSHTIDALTILEVNLGPGDK